MESVSRKVIRTLAIGVGESVNKLHGFLTMLAAVSSEAFGLTDMILRSPRRLGAVMAVLVTAPISTGRAQAAPSTGCLSPAQAAAPMGPVPVLTVRSMEADLATWQAAAPADSAARVAAFRRLVIDRWPDIYGPIFGTPDDRRLEAYLAWAEPRWPVVHRLFESAARALPPAARRVAAVFPALAERPVSVVLGLSLGRTNGTVRLAGDEPLLFLGLDVQAILADSVADIAALVEHELVHVAHARVNLPVYRLVDDGVRGVPTPVYVSLFSEGLAAWATGCVSPGRTVAERLFSPTLDSASTAAAGRLLPEFATVLDATDPARYGDWFFVGGRRRDIPPRFAYWVGERMIGTMARHFEPATLLRLDQETIRRETRAALERMCARGERGSAFGEIEVAGGQEGGPAMAFGIRFGAVTFPPTFRRRC